MAPRLIGIQVMYLPDVIQALKIRDLHSLQAGLAESFRVIPWKLRGLGQIILNWFPGRLTRPSACGLDNDQSRQ